MTGLISPIAQYTPVMLLLLFFFLASCWMLHRMRRHFAGTTLIGPWFWSIVAVASIMSIELSLRFRLVDAQAAPALRFLASAATFCPQMSLLGAKRPQDQAWHFVVAGLWLILVLPACEALLRGGGRPMEIQGLRTLFLVVLIAFGPINALGTRFFPATILFAIAQVIFLAPWLPIFHSHAARLHYFAGVAAAFAALCFVFWKAGQMARQEKSTQQAWRDFRDCFGVVWSLRVMERVNAAAAITESDVQLSWDGFRSTSTNCPFADPLPAIIQQALWNVLRRFVSDEWMNVESRSRSKV